MNIYRIIEDGVDTYIQAKTMQEAVKICEAENIRELEIEAGKKEDGIPFVDNDAETKYYHEQILESCQLIGELRN